MISINTVDIHNSKLSVDFLTILTSHRRHLSPAGKRDEGSRALV